MQAPTPINIRDLEAEIDEYGENQRQIDLKAPVEARQKVLEKKFKGLLGDTPGDRVAVLPGKRFELQFGVAANKRTITAKKKVFNLLKQRLGLDGVIALITIPFGEGVDKNLTAAEMKQCVTEELAGARSLNVVALGPPSPQKAGATAKAA